MNEWELEQRWQLIRWREPLPVQTPAAKGLACRFCIAMFGIKGKHVASLPQTAEEFTEHMQEHVRNIEKVNE